MAGVIYGSSGGASPAPPGRGNGGVIRGSVGPSPARGRPGGGRGGATKPGPRTVAPKPVRFANASRGGHAARSAAPRVTQVAPGVKSNNPLLNPGQSLSGASLYQAAQALANSATAGPMAELASQIAQNNRQSTGAANLAGGYFNQLGQQSQQGVQTEQGFANQLNQQLQGITGQTNSQLQGIGQNALSTLGKYTPTGEAATNTAAAQSLAAENARQQGLAAQTQGAYRSAGAMQGANYGSLAASQLATQGLAGTQAIRGILQAGEVKNEPLVAKQANLQAQKSSLLTTDLGKLRQQEVANRIAEQGLGIKGAALQNTVQNDRARIQATLRGQNVAMRGQNITHQNDLANQALRAASINATNSRAAASLNQRTAYDNATLALRAAAQNLKGKGGKPLTTSQQNTLYRNLDEMGTLVQTAQKAGHTEAQIKQALETGSLQKGLPAQSSTLVEAVYELLGWGHILPQTARAMHAMGLRGGTFHGQPIRVGPPPKQGQQPSQAAGGAITGAGKAIAGALGA